MQKQPLKKLEHHARQEKRVLRRTVVVVLSLLVSLAIVLARPWESSTNVGAASSKRQNHRDLLFFSFFKGHDDDAGIECPDGWKAASWTWYQSYAPCCPDSPNYDPSADTTECVLYSACDYTGSFAYIGQRSWDYVKSHNLIAFFSANGDNDSFARRTIRLSARDKTIEVVVADTCGDEDCDGCCTQNAQSKTGYLVDMEYETVVRNFGNIDVADGELCIQLVNETDVVPPNGFCNLQNNCTGEAQGGDVCNFDLTSCETGECQGSWCEN